MESQYIIHDHTPTFSCFLTNPEQLPQSLSHHHSTVPRSHFPHHTHVKVRYHSTHNIKSSFPQKQVNKRREQLSFFHSFAHFSCLATKKPNCFLSFSFAKTRPTRSLNWPVPRDWIQSLGGDAGAGLVTCPFATSPLALYHLD